MCLSVVRRCPECNRIVSAQHTKCIHCGTPFQYGQTKNLQPAHVLPNTSYNAKNKMKRQFRAAAVSIVTFSFVFVLGLRFMRHIGGQSTAQAQVIATSNMLHAAQFRSSSSLNSSIVGEAESGKPIQLTGCLEGERGQRWLKVAWNNSIVFVQLKDVTPPKVLEPAGADILKFYVAGMESPSIVKDAVSAVESYIRMFPSDSRNGELRWVLAERIKYLAQRAGSVDAAALRREAHRQYEQLANSNSPYAERARNVSDEIEPDSTPSGERSGRKTDGLKVVGGSGTKTSNQSLTAHEVLVLSRAEILVQASQTDQLVPGATVPGRLARAVKTNGKLAIPAGAQCLLEVIGRANSEISLALSSVEIDGRSRAVSSKPIDVSSGGIVRDRSLIFHLESPLVIER
ncbi:MAG: hypothetical protein CXZ00_03550 [Acidobacteria bacterium]|nr:MAG: hypothetical protein CXZ00_03550 [Acidobacteriota bacterium]